jgi:hypothetical protein
MIGFVKRLLLRKKSWLYAKKRPTTQVITPNHTTMLYNFAQHIKELHDNPEKKEEVLDRYIKYIESLDGKDIFDTIFYKSYLSKFEIPFQLVCPENLEDDFDWDLLVKLTVGSLSSEYTLVLDEEWKKNPTGTPRVNIYITVESGGEQSTKNIEELWSFQIIRLFEIYTEEQMRLFTLEAEDKKEEEEEEGNDYRSFSDYVENDELSSSFMEKIRDKLKEFHDAAELVMREARSVQKLKEFL